MYTDKYVKMGFIMKIVYPLSLCSLIRIPCVPLCEVSDSFVAKIGNFLVHDVRLEDFIVPSFHDCR